jgi:hypothetical protein
LRPAALGDERSEVAPPVLTQHDSFAIDERAVVGEAVNRLGDDRETIREVAPRRLQTFHALVLLAGEDAEAVMLDLVQPAGPSWRAVGERRLARANETGWRIASPTWRGGAPRYGFQVEPFSVGASRVPWNGTTFASALSPARNAPQSAITLRQRSNIVVRR